MDIKHAKTIIKNIMIGAVSAIGCILAIFLSYYSFRYSYSMKLDYNQEVFEYVDSLGLHFAVILVFLLLIGAIIFGEGYENKHGKTINFGSKKFIIAVMVVMFVISIGWIFGVKNAPHNDQGAVMDMIMELERGNYQVLSRYEYLGMVQFQIGLATVFRAFFGLFNSIDYHIIQVVNACCLPVMVFFGWKVLKLLFNEKEVSGVYCLLIPFCLPLYVYSAFVYGEMISTTVGVLMVWLVLWYTKYEKIRVLLPIGFCAIVGTMTRGNYWILIIACAITLFLYGLSRKKWEYLIVILCMVLSPLVQEKVMLSLYENKAGFELEEGMSKELWIAMGMSDAGDVANGWFNGYNFKTYYKYADTGEATAENATAEAKLFIHDRMRMFRNGVADWKAFYKEKVLSQWNEPTYECFSATERFDGEATDIVRNIYYEDLHRILEGFMNQYQLIIYIGFVLYIGYCVWNKVSFSNYLFVIYIIGGMLFSILWEASSRYIFPYFVFMIPCAAYGWACLGKTLWGKWAIVCKKIKKD